MYRIKSALVHMIVCVTRHTAPPMLGLRCWQCIQAFSYRSAASVKFCSFSAMYPMYSHALWQDYRDTGVHTGFEKLVHVYIYNVYIACVQKYLDCVPVCKPVLGSCTSMYCSTWFVYHCTKHYLDSVQVRTVAPELCISV